MVHKRFHAPRRIQSWLAGCTICMLLLVLGVVVASLFAPKSGLRGEYYPNTKWKGPPLITRDALPYLRKSDGADLLFTERYSVKWSGWISIDRPGLYHFATNSDDGSVLRLSGAIVVDNGGKHGLKKVSAAIELDKGIYPIEISYLQTGRYSVMELLWTPPGGPEERIPADVLFLEVPGRFTLFLRNCRRLILSVPPTIWGFVGLGLLSLFLMRYGTRRYRKPAKIMAAIALVVAVLPILYLLSFLPSLHQIPNNDYWGSFGHILRDGRFGGIFGKQNEHIVAIPNLIYFLNYALTKGNNQGLFVWNLLIVASTLIFALKILKARSPFAQRDLLVLAPLLSYFFFAPIQAHNFILSMSGTCWFPANFFLVASLYYLIRRLPQESLFSIGLAASLALCGVFSYSTGMFIFSSSLVFLLLYNLAFKKGLRFSGSYLLLFVLYAVWRFNVDPSIQKPASRFNPLNTLSFAVTTIGNPFGTSHNAIFLWGTAGLLLFFAIGAFVLYKIFYKKHETFFLHIAPWMICAVYGLTNMLAASMVRNKPLALRYTNITMIFWIGIFMSVLILLHDVFPLSSKRLSGLYPAIPALALGSLLLIPIYQKGFEKINNRHQAFKDQQLAALALQLHIYDAPILNKISIVPGQVTQQVPLIERTGHVPFNKILVSEYDYNTPLERIHISQDRCYGKFERLSRYNADNFQARGWVNCAKSQNRVKYLLLTNEHDRIKGAAIPIPPKSPEGTRITASSQQTYFGWKGLASLTQEDQNLSAYAVLQNGRLIALEQQQKVSYADE